ncbi:ATP-binding protein [Cryptosporangium phraense]|uniref:ATP-binding protein n=1 Tax=Cryptosporangium phraense TaxID=2593070 RepID=A0A545AKV5_9ACTN|nr:ATP-binding protein [Cryptosporangium phraense]TQS41948.1 ATP-binding protein [Cryptosporangium phraense]
MGELRWEVGETGAVTLVGLSGSLGLAGVPAVRGVLLKCLAECPAGVVVDLSGLEVSQATLLTVFPAVLGRTADWPAVPVVLAAPSASAAAALARTSVPALIPVHPTVESAVDAVRGGHPMPRVRLHLRPTDAASGQARALVEDACTAWGLDGIRNEAMVIATELADNAARHARTEFTVTVTYRAPMLHLAVRDRAHEPARLRRAATADGPPGKGLLLVDEFATGWGTLPVVDGKTTWAVVRAG